MTELRSFKTDEEVPAGTYVWFRFANLRDTTPKLGMVLGTVDCFLVVQTGPDKFNHVMVAPKWEFYEYEAPNVVSDVTEGSQTLRGTKLRDAANG